MALYAVAAGCDEAADEASGQACTSAGQRDSWTHHRERILLTFAAAAGEEEPAAAAAKFIFLGGGSASEPPRGRFIGSMAWPMRGAEGCL